METLVEDDKPALAIAMVVCLTRYGLDWKHAECTSRKELIAEARAFLDGGLDAERLSSPTEWPADAEFPLGAAVEKKGRAKWRGRVVGWYCTELTALGYAVESEFEPGSVQIYPATALVMREGDTSSPTGEYLWQLLSEHQSRDRTYMQIGRTDFLAALPLSDG